MTNRIIVACAFLVGITHSAMAQSVSINNTGNPPHPSAQLDIQSGSKGILIPRMTAAERSIIPSPATGLLVYQTDVNAGYYYFNGVGWTSVADNLGNHQLTQSLATGDYYLSRTGLNQGIRALDNGAVSIRTKNLISNIAFDGEAFRFDTLGNIIAIGRVLDAGNTSLANRIPIQGAGTRFMWYASRGALRFGRVNAFNSTYWDDANIDDFTFAGGNDVLASGYGAFAYGDQVRVTSVVGVGFGSLITVNGTAGFSAGASNTVNGFCGVAIGYNSRANGQGSVALGYRCSAANDYSVAIGYRATNNGRTGTMAMGDESTTDSVRNSADNQFVARYAGGYRFYTAPTVGGSANFGVFMGANANSWSSISDSTKKEKYSEANTDYFLDKLAELRLGSWNYKGDAGNRHYGPMAQEIFAAFGRDQFGVIGADTLLATADMDGIMMIMLKGLEKRSSKQLEENNQLREQLQAMALNMTSMREENLALKQELDKVMQMQAQLLQMQQQISQQGLAAAPMSSVSAANRKK